MFRIINHDIPKIERIDSEAGRLYKTPEGKLYPSVTTILGKYPNPHLEAWLSETDPKVAEQIKNSAAKRGSRMHELCEKFILKEKYWLNPFEPQANELFTQLVPYLNEFQVIHALETQLWSDKLRCAGTVDCIAEVGGELFIIDFKSSTGYKGPNDIPGYYMQTAAYSLMWYERTGILVKKAKILISCEEGFVLEYDQDILPWIKKFVEFRNTLEI